MSRPSAIGHRDDPRRPSLGAVEKFIDIQIARCHLVVPDDVAERNAPLQLRFREFIHLAVAVVGDQELLFRVEHAQSMRHVAQRGIETRIGLRKRIGLPPQQPCTYQDDDDDRGSQRAEDVEMQVPRLQHVAAGVGHDHDQREATDSLVTGDAGVAVNRARQFIGARVGRWQIPGKERSTCDRHAKDILLLRHPRQNPPVAVEQDDGAVTSEIKRAIDFQEIRLIERRGRDPRKASIGIIQPPRRRAIPFAIDRRTVRRRNEQPARGVVAMRDEVRHIGDIVARGRAVVGMRDDLTGGIGPTNGDENGGAPDKLMQRGVGRARTNQFSGQTFLPDRFGLLKHTVDVFERHRGVLGQDGSEVGCFGSCRRHRFSIARREIDEKQRDDDCRKQQPQDRHGRSRRSSQFLPSFQHCAFHNERTAHRRSAMLRFR